MLKHILLTGGSGLIGMELTELLLNKGYSVSHLSRTPGRTPNVKTYLWDINKGFIDEKCLDGVTTIVHLAGAGITDKRWTNKRRKELVDSRTRSIGLIYELLKSRPHQVEAIVSASATGYYGHRGDELMTEADMPGLNFLANCCKLWEQAVDNGSGLIPRILKFRTGVVLTGKGGALPLLAQTIKLGIGSALGNGRQWVPWIHHQDVVDLYLYGIENKELKGVYNMVAPNPVTNKQLTQAIAQRLQKPLWLPNVPAFVLKLLLGKMSTVVLSSTKVSAQKIEKAGYQFKFANVAAALANIYA